MLHLNLTPKARKIKTGKSILAMSWNIATEPKLYKQLAPNPYSPKALGLISKRFPDKDTANIIRAVIFAEPEGRFDRIFKLLSAEAQKEALSKQKETANAINKQLNEYYKKHAKELSLLPKESVYDILSKVVFKKADFKEIDKSYAQNQRREAKLSIVNFIEGDDGSFKIKPDQGESNLRRQLLIIAFAAFSIFLLYHANLTHKKQIQQRQARIEAEKQMKGLPMRLIIPKLNVDAVIQYVSVTSKGAMEVPTNAFDVGWFDLGVRPGEKGSSVIAGHFDGENGSAGVFTDLYKLKEGDKLYIQDAKGETIPFIVRKSRTYDPGYAKEVFNRTDTAHLNLITCDGVWDGAKKSYTKRLVVFTDLIQ